MRSLILFLLFACSANSLAYGAEACPAGSVVQPLSWYQRLFRGLASHTTNAAGDVISKYYLRPVGVAQGHAVTRGAITVQQGVASIFGGPRDRSAGGPAYQTLERLRSIGTGHNPKVDYYCALRLDSRALKNAPVLVSYGGRTIACRLNDKGPFEKGRMIDLSPAMARDLGFSGTVPVEIAFGKPGTPLGVPL